MGLEDQRVVTAHDEVVVLVATRASTRLDLGCETFERVGDAIELRDRGAPVEHPCDDAADRGRRAPGGHDIRWEMVVGADPKGRM